MGQFLNDLAVAQNIGLNKSNQKQRDWAFNKLQDTYAAPQEYLNSISQPVTEEQPAPNPDVPQEATWEGVPWTGKTVVQRAMTGMEKLDRFKQAVAKNPDAAQYLAPLIKADPDTRTALSAMAVAEEAAKAEALYPLKRLLHAYETSDELNKARQLEGIKRPLEEYKLNRQYDREMDVAGVHADATLKAAKERKEGNAPRLMGEKVGESFVVMDPNNANILKTITPGMTTGKPEEEVNWGHYSAQDEKPTKEGAPGAGDIFKMLNEITGGSDPQKAHNYALELRKPQNALSLGKLLGEYGSKKKGAPAKGQEAKGKPAAPTDTIPNPFNAPSAEAAPQPSAAEALTGMIEPPNDNPPSRVLMQKVLEAIKPTQPATLPTPTLAPTSAVPPQSNAGGNASNLLALSENSGGVGVNPVQLVAALLQKYRALNLPEPEQGVTTAVG